MDRKIRAALLRELPPMTSKKPATSNLNQLNITGRPGERPLSNPSCESADGGTAVYFRDIEAHLVHHIGLSSLVVGCVAWLTSPTILEALARVRRGVSIVVQKEDFLRPDLDHDKGWEVNLRRRYDALPSPPQRHLWHGHLLAALSQGGDLGIDAVRCVGNHNSHRKPAFPRMHNKFLVFCDASDNILDKDDCWHVEVTPRAVWTGSFNFTINATMSFENAVFLREPRIVQAYFEEWEQILSLSEPLDWWSEWIAPEWRIGT